MKIKKFVFNPFQVNSYIVYDQTGECLIIDASCYDKDEIKIFTEFISTNNLTPVKIVNTHGHVDHLPGNSFLAEKYSIDVAMHKEDLFLVESAVQHGLFFGFDISKPPVPSVFLKDKQNIQFGESFLEIRHAPGHSPGSVVLYSESDGFVITGDVLFAGSIGRTDLPGGNYEVLLQSIRNQLLTLPGNVMVYPGHGAPTTIDNERENNPFLK